MNFTQVNPPGIKQLMGTGGLWGDHKPHGLETFALLLTEDKLNCVDI